MRKLRLVGVVSMLLLVLFCSLATAADPVKIQFMTPLWNEEVRTWFDNEVVPEFERLNPDIKVEIIYVTWNEYDDKRLLTTAAGVGPDSWLVPSNGALVQGHQGQLIPLDRFVERYKDALNLRDYLPQALASQTLNGQLFAIPNTINVRTYATSIALFEQAGLDANAPLGQWPDFLRLVSKLTGAYDYTQKNSFKIPTLSQYWGGVLLESGVNWLTDDWQLRMDSAEGYALIDYLIALHDAGGKNMAMWTGGGLYDGKTAMAFIEVQNIRAADKQMGGNAYALPEPVNKSAVMPITGLGISSASKNPEAAWQWILFLSNVKNMARFNSFYGRIPPRFSAMRGPEIMNDNILRPTADIAARFAKYEPLMNPYGLDAASIATTRLREMFSGLIGPSQVIQDIQHTWDTKLAEVKAEEAKKKAAAQ